MGTGTIIGIIAVIIIILIIVVIIVIVIKNQNPNPPDPTTGVTYIFNSGFNNYKVYTNSLYTGILFNSTGTINFSSIPNNTVFNLLLIGGGGAGSGASNQYGLAIGGSGGGGAGVIYYPEILISINNGYRATVGKGSVYVSPNNYDVTKSGESSKFNSTDGTYQLIAFGGTDGYLGTTINSNGYTAKVGDGGTGGFVSSIPEYGGGGGGGGASNGSWYVPTSEQLDFGGVGGSNNETNNGISGGDGVGATNNEGNGIGGSSYYGILNITFPFTTEETINVYPGGGGGGGLGSSDVNNVAYYGSGGNGTGGAAANISSNAIGDPTGSTMTYAWGGGGSSDLNGYNGGDGVVLIWWNN